MERIDVKDLVPGKRYHCYAEDCCLSIQFTAVFLRAFESEFSEWPTTLWLGGMTLKAKQLMAELAPLSETHD